MKRQPRFEICLGDDGWWARFRAETYRRKGAALAAISAISPVIWIDGRLRATNLRSNIEVREIDERP